jgi:hypothetical protein
MLRQLVVIIAVLTLGISAVAQTQQPPAASPNPALRPDPARQMEQDMNEMESLLNNMAAETTFVKDTNMQILLNTNYRLWSILLRDLRMHMEQQKKADGSPKQRD